MRTLIGAFLVLSTAGCGAVGTNLPVAGTVRNVAKARPASIVAARTSAAVVSNPDAEEARANHVATTLSIDSASARVDGQAVVAAEGGLFKSPDGTIELRIPPGALTQDARVTAYAKDTAGKPIGAGFVPGIAFQLDLGGARIAPGASVVVSAKVDKRFVETMAARDASFTPDAYGLRKDTDGHWTMQMPVHGPALMPVAPPDLTPGWLLAENGALPLPGAGRKLLALAGQSSSQDCETWNAVMGFGVPNDRSEVRAIEAQGTFDCNAVHTTDWFVRILTDMDQGLQKCGGTTPTSPGASTGTPQLLPISANVTFVSDDPSMNGKPAAGARVRYDFTAAPGKGPTDVVADDHGNTVSFSLGGEVALTPYTEAGLQGDRVVVQVTPGMPSVPLKIKLPFAQPK
jgi:hypothetical protein